MIFTNSMNLPTAFVNAVSVERHNKEGCVSVTTLLKDPKEIILSERHWHETETDVAEEVWMLWGNMLHLLMEKQKDNTFKEEYFELQVTKKTKLTGRVDSYDMENELIIDWKTCSIYKILNKDFQDWEMQLKLYAYLMNKNGINVSKMKIVAFIKDWSRAKSKREEDYPKSQIVTLDYSFEKKDFEEMDLFVSEKIKLYESFLSCSDDEIPPCTEKNRWSKPFTYAVKKEGVFKAVRVFEDKELAEKLLEAKGDKHFIEERKGEHVKCETYCKCCKWCNFYKNEVAVY